jgi:polysaccharide pyruvyl transferase WcaK-like protein
MTQKIILYGHFGSGNIGNDSSLEAALYHIRKYRPDAHLICVCNGPQEIAERFGIETHHMAGTHAEDHESGRLKRLWLRLTDELSFWIKRPSWFRPGDQFIVVGTGAVDDMAVRRFWHSPYELYKWCKTAKMGGAQVIFLSVGVGPIVNRMSRLLMLKALRMADYRSYREMAAFDYLKSIGYDTTGDIRYPDLVFSLSQESLPAPQTTSSKVVGLGLITYYGWRHDPAAGQAVYQDYLSKIKRFAGWLFNMGYSIRIISGDKTDLHPVHEFVEFVKKEGEPGWKDRLIVEDINTVDDLLHQIAQTDIVVASRFHNVLCSLMLERPVISLGYHEKNVNLMNEVGLEKFCQHIDDFTFEKLVEQFECYLSEMDDAVQRIHQKNEQYRQLLDEQYRNILFNGNEAV